MLVDSNFLLLPYPCGVSARASCRVFICVFLVQSRSILFWSCSTLYRMLKLFVAAVSRAVSFASLLCFIDSRSHVSRTHASGELGVIFISRTRERKRKRPARHDTTTSTALEWNTTSHSPSPKMAERPFVLKSSHSSRKSSCRSRQTNSQLSAFEYHSLP